uniref:Uncharacterized protein n=1 Tax=Opuntia streptacantha TaxID=393608 RepID=A0A7C9A5Z2_OPUST
MLMVIYNPPLTMPTKQDIHQLVRRAATRTIRRGLFQQIPNLSADIGIIISMPIFVCHAFIITKIKYMQYLFLRHTSVDLLSINHPCSQTFLLHLTLVNLFFHSPICHKPISIYRLLLAVPPSPVYSLKIICWVPRAINNYYTIGSKEIYPQSPSSG